MREKNEFDLLLERVFPEPTRTTEYIIGSKTGTGSRYKQDKQN